MPVNGNKNKGKGTNTASPETVDFNLDGWTNANQQLYSIDVEANQPIAFAIRDDQDEDGNDTLIWTVEDEPNLGFNQEIYIFSENDDTNPDITIDTPVNPPLMLVENGLYKSVTIIIEDNDPFSDFDSDGIPDDDNFTLEPFKGTNNADTLIGTEKGDAIYGYAGDDLLMGQEGEDQIYGWQGNDALYGGDDDDFLVGNSGEDQLYGEDGTDLLDGGEGNDVLFGGDGDDQDLDGTGDDNGGGLYGSFGNDVLFGGDGSDDLHGEAGNDVMDGGPGSDNFFGGTGRDTYIVDDLFDTIYETPGTGIEMVIASVTWDLRKPNPSEADTLTGLDHLTLTGTDPINGTGNTIANIITGNNANNILDGQSNDDQLFGNAGNDTLYGGDGKDTLDGGTGADVLVGGAGAVDDVYIVDNVGDKIVDAAMTGVELVKASISWDLSISWNPNDLTFATQNDPNLSGMDDLKLTGDDLINGIGNYLSNEIRGNNAANTLEGRDADDELLGRGGNDRLIGGNGNDTLKGGNGADRFVFNAIAEGIDKIEDFKSAEGDKIEVSAGGFGAASLNQFSYNSSTGALSFNGTQFATLQNVGNNFVTTNDIVLV